MKDQHRWLALAVILLLTGCADPQKEDIGNNTILPPGQWIQTTPNPSPSERILHAMVYDTDNNQVILFGGKDRSGLLNDIWVYNTVDNTWTERFPVGPSPLSRLNHTMVYDPASQRVILFGGETGLGRNGETWAYDVATNTWTHLTPGLLLSPSARGPTAMVYVSGMQQAVLFGGETADGLDRETWVFDTINDAWDQKDPGTSPSARLGHAMAYDTNNSRAILFGGETSLESFTRNNETWAYDVFNDAWTNLTPDPPPVSYPSPRSKHAMVYDTVNGRVLMFGGFADGSPFPSGETWVYDYLTNRWSRLSPSPVPQSRFLHAMAYDSVDQEAVLFGGAIQGCGVGCTTVGPDFFLNDTWIYIPEQ